MNSFMSMEFPVGGHGPHPPKSYTPRCVPVKWVLAATMSPSAIKMSTWYRKSGRAVSQADSASLHRSRVMSLSWFNDMPGAIHSSITARLPLFQSSSKYLRNTTLFCSADIGHPFVRAGLPRHRAAKLRERGTNASCKGYGTFAFTAELTDHPGPVSVGGTPRWKRHQSRRIQEVLSRPWCSAPEQPCHLDVPDQKGKDVRDGQEKHSRAADAQDRHR